LDSSKANIGDIIDKITHNGFDIKAQVSRCTMAIEHGEVLFNLKKEPISPTCSTPFLTPIYEGRNS